MAVEDHQRIMRVRMRVEAGRQQHVRAEIDRPPPVFRQHLALDADVLDERRVRLVGDGRDLLVERERDALGVRGVEMNLDRLGIEIAGLLFQCWPSPMSGGSFSTRAVGEMEGLVAVQHRLHRVVAGFAGR